MIDAEGASSVTGDALWRRRDVAGSSVWLWPDAAAPSLRFRDPLVRWHPSTGCQRTTAPGNGRDGAFAFALTA
jgi:hypothetical protein